MKLCAELAGKHLRIPIDRQAGWTDKREEQTGIDDNTFSRATVCWKEERSRCLLSHWRPNIVNRGQLSLESHSHSEDYTADYKWITPNYKWSIKD